MKFYEECGSAWILRGMDIVPCGGKSGSQAVELSFDPMGNGKL